MHWFLDADWNSRDCAVQSARAMQQLERDLSAGLHVPFLQVLPSARRRQDDPLHGASQPPTMAAAHRLDRRRIRPSNHRGDLVSRPPGEPPLPVPARAPAPAPVGTLSEFTVITRRTNKQTNVRTNKAGCGRKKNIH